MPAQEVARSPGKTEPTALVKSPLRALRVCRRLPFSFDLDALQLPDSYLGTSFQIFHELACTVSRPWYTFPIQTKMLLLLTSRADSPMSSLPAGAAAQSAHGRLGSGAVGPHPARSTFLCATLEGPGCSRPQGTKVAATRLEAVLPP